MSLRVLRIRATIHVALGLLVALLAGCGGGEDFSTPVAGISERLAKSSNQVSPKSDSGGADASQPRQDESISKTTEVGAAAAANEESDTKLKKPNADTTPLTSASQVADPAPAKTLSGDRAESEPDVNSQPKGIVSGPATASAGDGKTSGESAARMNSSQTLDSESESANSAERDSDEGAMTASGRTAKSLAEKKDENSKMTVAENAGGLLSSLKGSKAAARVDTPLPVADDDTSPIISRFGRLAISQRDWLRLVSQLSRRFYVGTSADGTRILASSGERSGGVVQIETALEVPVRSRSSKAPQEELLQSITSLPGQIRCVELTADGSTALFGTDDGRVLVRMISGKHNWDLYARDLFLFQDEIRSTARLGEFPIVLLREINGSKMLSVNSQGQCAIWNIGDIIQPVVPIETRSASDLTSLASAPVNPAPVAAFEIEGLQVLSCCESQDGQWVALVGSDETITIIDTVTGTIVDQLTAAYFADTQPVCVAFLPERQELLAGLADGRIFRRAFGKEGTPVSGVNDAGEAVDYDAVFVPDLRDRPDAVTAIELIPGTNMAYIGSVTGTIAQLDISQRRMVLLPSKQSGAVLELKVCTFGTLAIGDERRATIFDQPVSPITRETPAPRVLEIPTDDGLKERSSADPAADGTRRSPTLAASRPEPAIDLEMVGIRPSNPELALLHHQLRVVVDDAQRQSVRRKILTKLGKDVRVLDPSNDGGRGYESGSAEPSLISEFTTDFLFTGRAWQDVRMSCSQDGQIVVLSHSSRPGIVMVDMPTAVVLRRWTGLPDSRQMHLNETFRRLIPGGPAAAELNPDSGAVTVEPTRRYLVCAVSPDQKSTVMGHFGTAGLATHALTRISDETASRSTALEMFESMVTSLAFSSNGDSLYASIRSRDQTTLLELEPQTLSIRSTLITEPLTGVLPLDVSGALDGRCGDVYLLSSASNRTLLTYGTHEDGPQLRLWRRTSKGWPKENVLIFREKDMLPDPAVIQPVVFVNQQDSKLAIVTRAGLSILNPRSEKLEAQLPIPDIGNRRPSCCFSPNAKWFFVGDADGKIWGLSLSSPTKKPKSFQAHSGPISGMAISSDGKFLLTAGEDNRVRSWLLREFSGS